ncbi:MAG: hypothetical protein AAGN66_24495 [Acidobacteriota bacterium]
MARSSSLTDPPAGSFPHRRPRRPYRPPRILERISMEAMAATCASPGSKPDPVTCPVGPIQS